MRKLFLLLCLVFAVYYGASLWNFTSLESFAVTANYYPIALLLVFFLLGLLHLRFALYLGLFILLLAGNPPLLNALLERIPFVPLPADFFSLFTSPFDSIIWGLFAAWIVVRFVGNPELDYEYPRAVAVRTLHFPIGIFAFTALLSALYSIIITHNVFYASFTHGLTETYIMAPFAFLRGTGPLAPLRQLITFLQVIALYLIVVNEVRTAAQTRMVLWVILFTAMILAVLAFLQNYWNIAFASGMFRFNREAHATFQSPNALAVFFLTVMPVSLALLLRGKIHTGIIGIISTILLIVGIVLTGTKMALLLAVIAVGVTAIIILIRAIKHRAIIPLVCFVIVAVLAVGAFIHVRQHAARTDDPAAWQAKTMEKLEGTVEAFVRGPWDAASINERSNYKYGDWITTLRMVNPMSRDTRDNLLRGVGHNRFRNHYHTYKPDWITVANRSGSSNMLLHVLAQYGIFGAIALLMIILFAIIYCFRSAPYVDYPIYAKATAWSLLFLVAACMTEDSFNFLQVQAVFWVLVGLCMVSASLAAARENKDIRGAVGLNALLLLVIIIVWGWLITPPLMQQRDNSLMHQEVAQRYSRRYPDIDPRELQISLEKTGDYKFNRPRGPWRYSEKNSFVLARITNPIMTTAIGCFHPDISTTRPVTATLYIDTVQLASLTFNEKEEPRPVVVDLREFPRLAPYLEGQSNVLIHINVDRTWKPVDINPDWTFDVGVYVAPITFTDTAPELPDPPAPVEELDPDADVEEPEDVEVIEEEVVAPIEEEPAPEDYEDYLDSLYDEDEEWFQGDGAYSE